MAKYTVLQMVQQILSAMDSDQVNSINDTPEAMQVAYCIQHSYNNMLGRYDLPEHNQMFQLTATGTSTPTLMLKPETGVQRIELLKYYDSNPLDTGSQTDQFGAFAHGLNVDIVSTPSWTTTSNSTVTLGFSNQTFAGVSTTLTVSIGQAMMAVSGANFMVGTLLSYSSVSGTMTMSVQTVIGGGTFSSWNLTSNVAGGAPPGYLGIELLTQEDFFDHINSFNPVDSTVGSYVFNINDAYTGNPYSFTLYYHNDHQPRYASIIGNQYVFFDALDSSQDTFLQQGKTLAYGWVIPQFTIADGFTPILDDQQFPMLVNESKSLAFLELKQTQHTKAEQEVARQLFSLQKFKHVANKPSQFSLLPNFGRRGGGHGNFSNFSTQYSW